MQPDFWQFVHTAAGALGYAELEMAAPQNGLSRPTNSVPAQSASSGQYRFSKHCIGTYAIASEKPLSAAHPDFSAHGGFGGVGSMRGDAAAHSQNEFRPVGFISKEFMCILICFLSMDSMETADTDS